MVDSERGGSTGGLNEDDKTWSPSAGDDPAWETEDFTSIDLGEDAARGANRPVRRLDLPPLARADAPGSGLPDPAGSDALRGMANGDVDQANYTRADDLPMFASVPDDPAVDLSPAATDPQRAVDGESESGLPSPEEPPAPPRTGAPPHPLSAVAAGGGPEAGSRSDHTRLRPVEDTHVDPGPGVGGPTDYTTPYRDDYSSDFSGDPRTSDVPYGAGQYSPVRPDERPGQGPAPGRAQLELAPPLQVEQSRPRWMLPAAAVLVALAIGAGYFFFIRDDSGDADVFAADTESQGDLVEEDLEDPDSTDAMAETDSAAGATSLSATPQLTLQGAADGPLEVETQYEMTIDGVPTGSLFLVIVDDIPQEPPLDYLPVLILPEGRHTISVQVTAGSATATTNPVDVYVLAPSLTATYRANLSSVNVVEEGWAEALRQYDEFRAAGHDGLMLSPSDPYPSLLPGFWNLYVPGFADAAEAQAYCEESGLAIPDACFPAPFDPAGPARDS